MNNTNEIYVNTFNDALNLLLTTKALSAALSEGGIDCTEDEPYDDISGAFLDIAINMICSCFNFQLITSKEPLIKQTPEQIEEEGVANEEEYLYFALEDSESCPFLIRELDLFILLHEACQSSHIKDLVWETFANKDEKAKEKLVRTYNITIGIK